MMPNTLNLEERATLAINCLTRNVDPNLSYTQYFDGNFHFEPPALIHHYYWDHCDGTARVVDALILARHMTGSTFNVHIDEKLKNLMLSFIGDKGLYWVPKTPYIEKELPLGRPTPSTVEFWGQKSCLIALLIWYIKRQEISA